MPAYPILYLEQMQQWAQTYLSAQYQRMLTQSKTQKHMLLVCQIEKRDRKEDPMGRLELIMAGYIEGTIILIVSCDTDLALRCSWHFLCHVFPFHLSPFIFFILLYLPPRIYTYSHNHTLPYFASFRENQDTPSLPKSIDKLLDMDEALKTGGYYPPGNIDEVDENVSK